jgi:hypothetical protein
MLPLELATHISSKTAAGSAIDFRLLSNIVVDGNVVIRGGSIARGQVQRVRKNKLFGQPGKLEIVVRSITAVDGTFVALAGGQLSEEGSDRLILSIMLTIFVCLLCFLIKGGDAEIPAGTQCVAIIPSDVEIEI